MWWYLVAVAIALGGFAAMAAFMLPRMQKMADELVQVVVPGEAELTLKKAGTYTIFHAQRSVVGDRLYVSDNISGLKIGVQSATTRKKIPIAPSSGSETYTFDNRSLTSAFVFDIPAPGRYRLVANYEDGRNEPLAMLAIGHETVTDIMTTVLGGLAIVFICHAVAIVMVVVVLNRRSAARAGA